MSSPTLSPLAGRAPRWTRRCWRCWLIRSGSRTWCFRASSWTPGASWRRCRPPAPALRTGKAAVRAARRHLARGAQDVSQKPVSGPLAGAQPAERAAFPLPPAPRPARQPFLHVGGGRPVPGVGGRAARSATLEAYLDVFTDHSSRPSSDCRRWRRRSAPASARLAFSERPAA